MPPRLAPIVQIKQTNQDSMYFVRPSEGPKSVLVTPPLNGSNYLAWSRSMTRALGAKNKLCFIDRSLPVPYMLDLNINTWERCNHLLHSWIINSVSEPITQTLVFHEYVFYVWEDLNERFSKADRIRIGAICSSIHSLKQGSKSVIECFTELKSLWEELNSHRPIPMCSCIPQSRCKVMRAARNQHVKNQVIQFLQGLNDKFLVVKTQVLLMDPLPSLNKVYSLVVQEESNYLVISSSSPVQDDSNTLINDFESRKPFGHGNNSSFNKNSSRFSTFCNRTNHNVEFCYQKHGHPSFNKKSSYVNASHGENSEVAQGANAVVPLSGLNQE